MEVIGCLQIYTMYKDRCRCTITGFVKTILEMKLIYSILLELIFLSLYSIDFPDTLVYIHCIFYILCNDLFHFNVLYFLLYGVGPY